MGSSHGLIVLQGEVSLNRLTHFQCFLLGKLTLASNVVQDLQSLGVLFHRVARNLGPLYLGMVLHNFVQFFRNR